MPPPRECPAVSFTLASGKITLPKMSRTGPTAFLLLLLTGIAQADAVDDVKAAISKLEEASSYSWSYSMVNPKNRMSIQGKAQKDGVVWKLITSNNTLEGYRKGDRWVVKMPDGWRGNGSAPVDGPAATAARSVFQFYKM